MADALATIVGIVAGILVTSFIALSGAGVVLLARRARREALAPPRERTDAGVALVRADDAVRAAEDELEFARAQFGEDRTRGFADALDRARGDLRRAFELQHRLDTLPEGSPRRKDWAKRIRSLADRARLALAEESRRFEELRRAEAQAADTVRRMRETVAELRARRAAGAEVLAELRRRYVDAAVEPVAGNLERADEVIPQVGPALDDAEAAIASGRVTAVTDALRAAQESLHAASALVDAVSHRRDELAAADAQIAELRRELEAAVAEARALRDDPPDPESADALNDAIAAVDREVAAAGRRGRRDPLEVLDRLVDAGDALDIAVAAARNQRRRLEGARTALAGALVSARAQLSAVSDYIGAHGGSAGARARLAEGRRELLLAENESDPVTALDAARRAQTHARDADALARYDAMLSPRRLTR